MKYQTLVVAASCYVGLLIFGRPCEALAQEANAAGDQATLLAPFVNDDTFFVGQLDLGGVSDADQLRQLILQLPQNSPQDTVVLSSVAQALGGLRSAGAASVYAVLGLGDVHQLGGPLVIVAAKGRADSNSLENMLRGVLMSVAAIPDMPPITVERRGADVFIIGTEPTVARYKSLQASSRSDLLEPLAKMRAAGATIAAVFSPGADFRRVVRATWPALPEPLTAWKGELADRWLRLEFSADLSSTPPSAEFVMQATDAASANLFAQLLRALPAASERLPGDDEQKQRTRQVVQTILDAVPPTVDGAEVVMRLPTAEDKISKLQGLLGKATDAALESNRRQERMLQFKQMALAMYMYADKGKHFPPHVIRDANGKPLLSWRVAILPYLDQNDLYQQFHLDEPWDSPHNLALARPTPSVYSDPSQPELRVQARRRMSYPSGRGRCSTRTRDSRSAT